MKMTDDARLRAIINESRRNERDNPAAAAGTEHAPHVWTADEEADLVQRIHGDERERIDRLIAEFNEAQRRR